MPDPQPKDGVTGEPFILGDEEDLYRVTSDVYGRNYYEQGCLTLFLAVDEVLEEVGGHGLMAAQVGLRRHGEEVKAFFLTFIFGTELLCRYLVELSAVVHRAIVDKTVILHFSLLLIIWYSVRI